MSRDLKKTESSTVALLSCEVKVASVESGIQVELPESAVPGCLFGGQGRKPGEKLEAIVYYQDDKCVLLFDSDAAVELKHPELIYPSRKIESLEWIGTLCFLIVLAGLAFSPEPALKSIFLGLSALFVIVMLSCRLQAREKWSISLNQYMSGATNPEIRTVLIEKVGRGEKAQIWCYLSGTDGDLASYAHVSTYGSADPPWPLITLFGDPPESQLLSKEESSNVHQQPNGKIVLKNTIVVRNPKFKSQILLAWQNHMFLVYGTGKSSLRF